MKIMCWHCYKGEIVPAGGIHGQMVGCEPHKCRKCGFQCDGFALQPYHEGFRQGFLAAQAEAKDGADR